MRTTYMAKPGEVDRKWYVVDAKGVALGRLAAAVAKILRGKNKPTYTPHVDTGDFVIIINAAEVKLTGNKLKGKKYYRHTPNQPGGFHERTAADFLAKQPTTMVEMAVKGMLPHTPLGRKMGMKLHVYAGAEHDNAAQKPEKLDITKLI